MKTITNTGTDRVTDLLSGALQPSAELDLASNDFSLFAFAELRSQLQQLSTARLLLPAVAAPLGLLGTDDDRVARNRLEARWLAAQCSEWIERVAEARNAPGPLPQGAAVLSNGSGPEVAVTGPFGFTTEGLGITPGNPMSFIQGSETDEDTTRVHDWFIQQWASLPSDDSSAAHLLEQLDQIAAIHPPALAYAAILSRVFESDAGDLDDERIVNSATGIRETHVWQKLYKFQRDGAVSAIDKLERFGGCIIADSVGLGKTFEALAVIKYHELRNDRVLVLCPKRLRENWTLYAANDRRNPLAEDRFNYDVLNHTDLSRERGKSGDIDLGGLNWGNYDLIVIDESHNFRNKQTPKKGGENRYARLMRKIIREGVKTRVLMLSATPVNNRLADLRNQIAFATEGKDGALASEGIQSIDATTTRAQKQFNLWLKQDEADRTPEALVESLGFDYFKLLDRLTIARSRRHIEKYYGTAETGKFPERLKPINVKCDIDLNGEFRPIEEINKEIRKLHLAAYTPLRYVLPTKRQDYDLKYSTEVADGKGLFRQVDRENSLIDLMRVNVLKRLESAVSSFALTLERQLGKVDEMLARLDEDPDSVTELDINDLDLDDPNIESLLVGGKIKVLVKDVDVVRWRQDLIEDRDRLRSLLDAALEIDVARDAKLEELKTIIKSKCSSPINPENRKVIVFTAFADTANYLYENLADWAKENLGVEAGLVTGGAKPNRSTISKLPKDMMSVLSAFSPRAKERPAEMTDEGEIDLLIATDCVSEGQNLQDCDWLINYDIHWNPVRIVQRFGRIDRLGSINECVQLVNLWPNMELEEYINLEQKVGGRMVLLDISATGEENLLDEQSAGNLMNDLKYRRDQLLKMQETVVDIEDLSAGVSITDLTLADFRIDLTEQMRENGDAIRRLPLGALSVTFATEEESPSGMIFCLQAVGPAAEAIAEGGYPLAPYYLVQVSDDGTVTVPFMQVQQLLSRLKEICVGGDTVDPDAVAVFDKATSTGANMAKQQDQLAAAIASIAGKGEERAAASIFTPGGTQVRHGEFAGSNDFEVIAMLAILSES
jgi:SNF2 family DNA or RNA helicase